MRAFARISVALSVAFAMTGAQLAEACIPADRAALLVLDASYSMLRPVGRIGPTRFNLARAAVAAVVDLFPDDGYLALRFYGARSTATHNDCTDTNLAVPFAPAAENREAIKLALAKSHARGRTPIAYALGQMVADFAGVDVEKIVIVVSDGMESCDGDPCAIAETLAPQGFVIHTVGFLVDSISRRQLQCIAKATGGSYFDAPVALDLEDQLRQAFAACPIALAPPSRREDDDPAAAG